MITPVDILIYAAVKLSGFPENRVLGSVIVLDTVRLKFLLGEHLQVDSRAVHAFITGEHRDSEFAVWISTNISGLPFKRFLRNARTLSALRSKTCPNPSKNSAYEIIERKGAAYYGIAMSVLKICEAILPVSCVQNDEFGIGGVTLSLPVIVGKNSIEGAVPISLSDLIKK